MILYAGFLLGFMGSFHCVGMCGPIALSVPLSRNGRAAKHSGALLYLLGKTTAYALLGAVLGALGMGAAFMGGQQILSIALGTLLLAGVLLPGNWAQSGRIGLFTGWVKRQLGHLLRDPRPGHQAAIGFFNGLLPCGLVYLGIAGALSLGHVWQGSLFMVAFGLGTAPALLATMLLGNWAGAGFRNALHRLSPVAVGLMAVLLILRGLDLGIPYLSPQLENMTKVSRSDNRCH